MGGRPVAVFGSSEPLPGDPLYDTAHRLGHRLARAGFAVTTGGYGGVMEAASRGAFEAGGHTIGVVSTIFSERDPNPYNRQLIDSNDLFERTRGLIERAAAFTIVDGKAGTLSELSFLWALDRARTLGERPIVVIGDYWRPLIELCGERGHLEPAQLERTRVVDDPAEAVAYLRERLGPA